MTAVQLLPPTADRGEWLKRRREGIGASEIAAVMGVSPFESPFSLWWRKRQGWDIDPTPEMETGTFLEPTIADWYMKYHAGPAGLEVGEEEAGLWASGERAWQLATPDRLLYRWGDCGQAPCDPDYPFGLCAVCATRSVVGVLECKWVAYSWDGWGDDGSPVVPVHYRAQVLWQMDVMGVNSAVICALGPGGFRVYYLLRDEKDLTVMREAGQRFMTSLLKGDPPNVDDHTATLPTVKRLNGDIADRDQEIPQLLASGWLRSKRFKDLAERVERRYSARLRAHMGDAKTAVCAGQPVAFRTSADQLRRKAYTLTGAANGNSTG